MSTLVSTATVAFQQLHQDNHAAEQFKLKIREEPGESAWICNALLKAQVSSTWDWQVRYSPWFLEEEVRVVYGS